MYSLRWITISAASLTLAACGADAPLALHTPALGHPEAAARAEGLALAPTSGTVVHRADIRVDPPPGPFTLVHAMLDFHPGTWFPAHVHGGPGLYTMVEGSVTVFENGAGTEYHAGDSYRQDPGQVLSAGNFGSLPASMAVAFVLPEGEDLITFHPGDDEHVGMPFPDFAHTVETGPLTRSVPFSVVQFVIDLEPQTAPPALLPARAHPGPSLVTVLTGEVIVRRAGEEEQVVAAGNGWVLTQREPARVRATERGARLVATYLVPRGEVLGVAPASSRPPSP